MSTLKARERIILALDTNSPRRAAEIIDQTQGLVGPIKIGLEAISAGIANELTQMVLSVGGKVFHDGKWHDIPNTVAGTIKGLLQVWPEGIWAANVHASGGREMMAAAVENRGQTNIWAVTLLTSLNEEDAVRLYKDSVDEVVLRLALEAKAAGVQGLISSPRELKVLAAEPELSGLDKTTPAIRPLWSVPQDQKRPTTPKDAILGGATNIVVGRPITDPPDGRSMREACQAIEAEIEEALQEMAAA